MERTIQHLIDGMFNFWEKYLDTADGKLNKPGSGRIFDVSFQKDGYDFSEYSFYVSYFIDSNKRKSYVLLEKVYDNEFMNESLGFKILYEIVNYGKNLKAIATNINNKIKNS